MHFSELLSKRDKSLKATLKRKQQSLLHSYISIFLNQFIKAEFEILSLIEKNDELPQSIQESIVDQCLAEPDAFELILSNLNSPAVESTYNQRELASLASHLLKLLDGIPYTDENIKTIFELLNQNATINDSKKLVELFDTSYQMTAILQIGKLKELQNKLNLNPSEDFKLSSDEDHSLVCFKKMPGWLNTDCKYSEKDRLLIPVNETIFIYELLELISQRFTRDNGLLIPLTDFYKIIDVIACFENKTIVTEILNNHDQSQWLKIVLQENIIEKYFLLYKTEQTDHLKISLSQSNQDLLLLFNNLLADTLLEEIYVPPLIGNGQPDFKKSYPLLQLTQVKFDRIVNFIECTEVSQTILDQLSEASLSIWDTILYEVQFSQRFSERNARENILTEKDDIEKCLLYLNRIRINLGVNHYKIFYGFFNKCFDKILSKALDNKKFIEFLSAIHYKKITFEQANTIIFDDRKDLHTALSSLIEEQKYPQHVIKNHQDLSASKLIDLMKNDSNYETINGLAKNQLDFIAEQAREYKKNFYEHNNYDEKKNSITLKGTETAFISDKLLEIRNNKDYQKDPESYTRANLPIIIPLLLQAWASANGGQVPRDTQLVSLLLTICSNDKGLLQQVKTGEGKTLIVGLVAAFLALCGHAVDIVSSNRDLAIEGQKKCDPFFSLLNLNSAHICNEDEKMNAKAYQAHIVYGETASFQRDILETEFNNKAILGDRYMNKPKSLIVDEVDSLSLDKARHVLYLSHSLDNLKWLEFLFTNIWAATIRVTIKDENNFDREIKEIAQGIQELIRQNRIYVPGYLKTYVENKLERWVSSAFQAMTMQESNHFVIDKVKNNSLDKERKDIIPMDKDTGVELYSTRWSDGLAQFLELKYRKKISVESLKAVFMSNKTFLLRYDKNLYGLTGTLGSEESQQFIADLYNVRFAKLPTSKPKQIDSLPPLVAVRKTDWLELVAETAATIMKDRAVLIICESVDLVEEIQNVRMKHLVSPHKIKTYARDSDNIERHFAEYPASADNVIIATSKGGRGTDIQVDKETYIKGGMHVILTYMPTNDRIEEQAFGRTARNGAPGSSQFIIQVDEKEYDTLYFFSPS